VMMKRILNGVANSQTRLNRFRRIHVIDNM